MQVIRNISSNNYCTLSPSMQDFFLTSSSVLYEATYRLSQFDKVVIQIPREWTGRGQVTLC